MLKSILFLTLSFISLGFHAQTNNGSFMMVQVYGRNHRCAIIDSQTFEKFQSEISLDSSKMEQFGSCQVLFISQGNKVIKEYRLSDISGLNLGKIKDSLKDVNIRYGIGADLKFSNLIADSLVRDGVYFYTVPQLNATESYQLDFKVLLKENDGSPVTDYSVSYTEFRRAFEKEFEQKGKHNVHMHLDKNGELSVLLYLQNQNFDFKNLDKYKLTYSIPPKVKPRLYEIILLEK
jgi:hypothetical protein